jgi:hypothetical protein
LLIVGFDQRLGVYRQGIFLLPGDVRLTTFRKSVDKENPIPPLLQNPKVFVGYDAEVV